MKVYLSITVALVLHLASEANGQARKLTTGTWSCVKAVTLKNLTYTGDKSKFGPGDCFQFHADDQPHWEKLATSGKNFTSALPKTFTQFPNNSFGVFSAQPASQCGGKNGIKLLNVSTAPVKDAIKAPITCPAGQVAMQKVANTNENKCTTKYGNADSPWEQDGLLCYPNCNSGYYGVGPACWTRCPPNSHDGGVLCTKETYVPHTRAVMPWSHCHSDEFHYAFECITKCKSGYNKYWSMIMYYCGTGCGPHMTDSGLTCTKHSYGRGVGKLAVPVWEFALIVAASVVLGAAITVGTGFVGVAVLELLDAGIAIAVDEEWVVVGSTSTISL
eukprot:CAMPEP_0203752528 /NCGR_PEP_ID=MMETSP0098-20131031/6441_1 /ASSEMBLY_ACC=CAM_ASM_000208 /TAXON_ID=96639 /ORGANISM=" , Strain NY0313808BC1" /LENGTH=330 /DNA_ID=CAMNT_0050642735 /DNA_START=464 /DNA_END=1456 /DNA_ORIENTATION=+